MCNVLLPPGGNRTAVKKYILYHSYRNISYIISYHVSYRISSLKGIKLSLMGSHASSETKFNDREISGIIMTYIT